MDKNKDKIEYLCDEILYEITDHDKADLHAWEEAGKDNKAFRRLIREMKLSAEVEKQGEALKPYVFQQVNKRINRAMLFRKISRAVSVAASIILLVGITGYYSYQQGFREINSQQIEMSNPLGMRSTLTLPDGSKVILNAGTTISYPNAFVSKNREIRINGEAYLEVVHDKDHPFIVRADDIRIEVLGTAFNVKAYENDERVEVSLSEGSVRVQAAEQKQPVLLTPGEQAYYDKGSSLLTRRKVTIDHYISWKEGKYYFEKLPLEEIMRQLERIFNVHVYIATPQLGKTILTGDFTRGENLEQILRVITADKRLKYRIEEDRIYIDAR
ncbi:DUF4974 domain-containing protein [Parabacteroides sp. OttesenSCG-928-G06]|nr:DUF4974 domain-containing protein [Parabacteroides sp. OttesenSCG-928-G06]